MTAAPIHAVPLDAPKGRDHSASATCWCGPSAWGRDLSTAALVWRHRTPQSSPGTPRPALDQAPARYVHVALRGRPPGEEITAAALLDAAEGRASWDPGPPTQERLATDLGRSRSVVREAVIAHFGSWTAFVDKCRGRR